MLVLGGEAVCSTPPTSDFQKLSDALWYLPPPTAPRTATPYRNSGGGTPKSLQRGVAHRL